MEKATEAEPGEKPKGDGWSPRPDRAPNPQAVIHGNPPVQVALLWIGLQDSERQDSEGQGECEMHAPSWECWNHSYTASSHPLSHSSVISRTASGLLPPTCIVPFASGSSRLPRSAGWPDLTCLRFMTDGRFYTQVLLKEVKVKPGVGLGPPGYTELQEYKESLGEETGSRWSIAGLQPLKQKWWQDW